MSNATVAVIGGGFAGLSAATALAETGVHVRVFEARPTLGGRANTFRDPVTGDRIDNGQHVLAGCYDETLCLLRRIGSSHLLHWPSTLRVRMIDEAGQHSELVLPPLPAPFDLASAAFSWSALTSADRWSMLRVATAIRGRGRVDRAETVRDWLRRHGQSERLCRLLWEPLALAALNQPIDRAAAASFIAVTSRMFSGEPNASALLLPAVPLDQLYVAPAHRFLLERSAEITTRARSHVVWDGDRAVGVAHAGELFRAEMVICAVPWFAFADATAASPHALTALKSAATAMQSSPIVTVNLWFDEAVDNDAFFGLPGRTFQWVFARDKLVGGGQSHLSLVSSGADSICNADNDQVVNRALADLCSAVPAFRRRGLRHAHVIREKRATFSLSPCEPRRPPTRPRVEGLLLAGDWIETGLPATIESAVVSGHRAAAACLQLLRTIRK